MRSDKFKTIEEVRRSVERLRALEKILLLAGMAAGAAGMLAVILHGVMGGSPSAKGAVMFLVSGGHFAFFVAHLAKGAS